MKKRLDPDVSIPMPVVLVGATCGGRANFMAVGWVTRANYSPPVIAVCLNKRHFTPEGIREHGTFSVCFPGRELIEATDCCGIVSGRAADKSGLFTVFYGETKTAPMIEECPLCIECRLREVRDLESNAVYFGEMVAAYAEESALSDGAPDYRKMGAFLLTMPDKVYWSIGEPVGKAWSDGKRVRERLKG